MLSKQEYDRGLNKIQQGFSEYTEDNPGTSEVTQFQLLCWADMARQGAKFSMDDFLEFVALTDPLTVPGTRFVAQWSATSGLSGKWAQFTVLEPQVTEGYLLWTDDVYAAWEDIDRDSIQQVQPPLTLPEED